MLFPARGGVWSRTEPGFSEAGRGRRWPLHLAGPLLPRARRTAPPCRWRLPPAEAPCPRAGAGRCAPRAPPGRWRARGSPPAPARREHRLDGGGHVDLPRRPRDAIGPPIPREYARLDQRPDAFLQEERVAAGAFDKRRLERRCGPVTPQQAIEEDVGIVRRERVEPELCVIALAAPGVLVLEAVADEEQNAMARETLDQDVEHRLRLGVDPVEIFDDDDDRLAAALLQEQQPQRFQRPLPLLGRIEFPPLPVVGRHIQEREEGGKRRCLRSLERQHLLRYPLPDFARVVARLDMEVRLQQVDDREIGRRLPVGGRAADKDQRVPEAVRCDELPEETRLADAGLAYHRHDLTGICPRLLQRSGELLELRAPGHEGRELFA